MPRLLAFARRLPGECPGVAPPFKRRRAGIRGIAGGHCPLGRLNPVYRLGGKVRPMGVPVATQSLPSLVRRARVPLWYLQRVVLVVLRSLEVLTSVPQAVLTPEALAGILWVRSLEEPSPTFPIRPLVPATRLVQTSPTPTHRNAKAYSLPRRHLHSKPR